MNLKCKDLRPFADKITESKTLEEARHHFIVMCQNFDFKKKSEQHIRDAKNYRGNREKFLFWSWNIIMKADGNGVLKI